MNYVPREPRDDVNIPSTHPLKELVLLVAGVAAVATAGFFVLAWLVQLAVPLVPMEVEAALFSSWGPAIVDGLDAVHEHPRIDDVRRLVQRLVVHWPDQPYTFHVGVVPDDQLNAFAVPGGAILLTSEMLESVEDEAELAFVLAHELGHFHNRDHLDRLGRILSFRLILAAIGFGGGGASANGMVGRIEELTERRFGRDEELAADRFALEVLAAEYGHVGGAPALLEQFEANEAKGSRWLSYFATHPPTDDRIERLRELALERGWPLSAVQAPPVVVDAPQADD